ncbi:DUF4974 domain-containing protein [Puteibacter caeruleilacunae]|nr:DUF4974 domain-containing protein [Puteibacter caeruleilacunae]
MKQSNIESVYHKIQLLSKYKRLNDEEYETLKIFLQSDNDIEQLNLFIKANWDNSEKEEANIDFKQILNKIKQREADQKAFRKVKILKTFQKYAAIFLLPLIIYASYVTLQMNISPSNELSIGTKKGERTCIVLPDGTEAHLNVDTKLTYNNQYNNRNRTVFVDGEAFFKVKKNAKIPFIATLRNLEVKALGTEFSVKGYKGDKTIEASLLEGSVSVRLTKSPVKEQAHILKPGQSLTLKTITNTVQINSFNKEIVNSWRENRLFFENTPFEDVVNMVERWFNVTINFNPSEFTNDALTVRLDKGDSLKNLLEVINGAIGIDYTIDNNIINIKKRQPM